MMQQGTSDRLARIAAFETSLASNPSAVQEIIRNLLPETKAYDSKSSPGRATRLELRKKWRAVRKALRTPENEHAYVLALQEITKSATTDLELRLELIVQSGKHAQHPLVRNSVCDNLFVPASKAERRSRSERALLLHLHELGFVPYTTYIAGAQLHNEPTTLNARAERWARNRLSHPKTEPLLLPITWLTHPTELTETAVKTAAQACAATYRSAEMEGEISSIYAYTCGNFQQHLFLALLAENARESLSNTWFRRMVIDYSLAEFPILPEMLPCYPATKSLIESELRWFDQEIAKFNPSDVVSVFHREKQQGLKTWAIRFAKAYVQDQKRTVSHVAS